MASLTPHRGSASRSKRSRVHSPTNEAQTFLGVVTAGINGYTIAAFAEDCGRWHLARLLPCAAFAGLVFQRRPLKQE